MTGKIFLSLKCTGRDDHQHRSVTVDEQGITCWARMNLDGELVKFNPPQTMIAAPLKKGAGWNFDGQAGDTESATAL